MSGALYESMLVVEIRPTGEDILFRILAPDKDFFVVRERWGTSSRFARLVVKARAIDIVVAVCGLGFGSIKKAAIFSGTDVDLRLYLCI